MSRDVTYLHHSETFQKGFLMKFLQIQDTNDILLETTRRLLETMGVKGC